MDKIDQIATELAGRLLLDIPRYVAEMHEFNDGKVDKVIVGELLDDQVARAWDDHPELDECDWEEVSNRVWAIIRPEFEKLEGNL